MNSKVNRLLRWTAEASVRDVEHECVIPHLSTQITAKGNVDEPLCRGLVNGAMTLMQ
jgi:hypothetical protein